MFRLEYWNGDVSMNSQIDKNWFEQLASSSPTPGGGGAAAMAGAAGAALGLMVANLTVGKKKYAGVEGEIREYIAKLEALKDRMLELIEADAEGFAPLAAAYSLPSSTDGERARKEEIMAEALKEACQVPLAIMEKGVEILDIIDVLAVKGSVMAVSDAGVAAQFARTAVLGASMNVFINTKSMKDIQLAARYNGRADELNSYTAEKADKIFKKIEEALKCR